MTLLYKTGCFFSSYLFRLFYKHKVYGLENIPKGAALIAANHLSYLDTPLLAVSCPEEAAFLAKNSLFQWFLFGWLIRQLNAYPLSGTASDHGSIKTIYSLLKNQMKVAMFPEGIRSSNGKLNAIKPGIAAIAIHAQVPIIPTYIHGTFEIWPPRKTFPKLWGRTAIAFGRPIYPQQFQHLDKKAAKQAITDAIRDELICLRAWYESK